MKKTIISLFILVTALFLVLLSSEAAQINFYDIDDLSPKEQASIIKEKPSVSEKYEQYNLIYQKISAAATPNDNSNSGLLIGTKNDGMTAKTSSQSQLPKAGEPLLPKENISISKDETKIIEPTLIEGYDYVGYYPDAEVIPLK